MGDKYDFSGWVTKNNMLCSDGVIIRQGAFKDNDNKKVPLVWMHNYSSPTNVIGHMILKHEDDGVYGYGYLNESVDAKAAKEMLKNGDITHLSIGAKNIKKNSNNVIHGNIYEVSLVLAGANPGALIQEVLNHDDSNDLKAVIFNDYEITHGELDDPDEVIQHEEDEEDDEDILENFDLSKLTEDESDRLAHYLNILSEGDDDELNVEAFNDQQFNDMANLLKKIQKGDNQNMKQNAFENGKEDLLQQSELLNDVMQAMVSGDDLQTACLKHGITSIEDLFPASQLSGERYELSHDTSVAATIVNSCSKSPFGKTRTEYFDLTGDAARALGYKKGSKKKDEIIRAIKRETPPTTIYKKQTLDRDDVIDLEDPSIILYLQAEMKRMLILELARCIMIGDGRDISSQDKVDEGKIRPIISDNDVYTIQGYHESGETLGITDTNLQNILEKTLEAKVNYKGSGMPKLYIHPKVLLKFKLLRNPVSNEKYYKSLDELKDEFGVSEIVEVDFLSKKNEDKINYFGIICNLADYNIGASKGGEITSFEDFNLDYNQHRYLSETRVSGALKRPRSAVVMTFSEKE